jgi:hypothetical protein
MICVSHFLSLSHIFSPPGNSNASSKNALSNFDMLVHRLPTQTQLGEPTSRKAAQFPVEKHGKTARDELGADTVPRPSSFSRGVGHGLEGRTAKDDLETCRSKASHQFWQI